MNRKDDRRLFLSPLNNCEGEMVALPTCEREREFGSHSFVFAIIKEKQIKQPRR